MAQVKYGNGRQSKGLQGKLIDCAFALGTCMVELRGDDGGSVVGKAGCGGVRRLFLNV